ncbi:MAG: ABC transporter substrate-binding protein [Rubrivivax sp.]
MMRSSSLALAKSLLLATVSALTLMAASPVLAQAPAAADKDKRPVDKVIPDGKTKTLRYAFRVAETAFDPPLVTDLYSRTVIAGIFDAPFEWAYLARPFQMRPNTAAEMPEISADFKTFTIRLKPGIYFADDPTFKGQKRELVAQDYVYALKRHYDPQWKSGNLYILESAKILGLSELRKELIAAKKPFDYDREVEGLKALDRYTLQIKLGEPAPRFMQYFADASFTGAVAREVVEFYGDKIGAHPVGTGPFRLASWTRSSRIVLERNPNYREVLYNETAPADRPDLQKVAAQLKGRRLPMLDRVVISIIEENQPRWLSFLNQEADLLDELPADFANTVIPNNQLAPNLARQGIRMNRFSRADIAHSYFAMEHPVVGGYTPEKVALRRAISLAVDMEREIRMVRRNQAIPAQSTVGPNVWGYDPTFKSEMSEYNLPRAKALLDMYGYVDRDGDGWRDLPDGKPLLLEYATQPDQQSRQLIEQWKRNMDALKVRIEFKPAKWPENLKSSRAGKLMMWGVGWLAGQPDADTFIAMAYGPNKGQSNHARFDHPEVNRLYEQQRMLPDGPERQALINQARNLIIAYMPYKVHVHRIFTDLTHPWVTGYERNIFVREQWKYVDVDAAAQRAAVGR